MHLNLIVVMLLLSACDGSAAPAAESATLNVLAYSGFNIPAPSLQAFETQNHVKVVVVKAGAPESTLRRAITTTAGMADVVYGVDSQTYGQALQANLFAEYAPAGLEGVPQRLRADPQNRLQPVDLTYITINYDNTFYTATSKPVTLRDLTDKRYFHKLVIPHPKTSFVGLAFLMLTIATFPEGGDYSWQMWWTDLIKNAGHMVPTWGEAYGLQFSGTGNADAHPLVIGYRASPAADVLANARPNAETRISSMEGVNFEVVRYAGILKAAHNTELARRFMDFLLSEDFQREVAAAMYAYPVLPNTALPVEFTKLAPRPTQFVSISPDDIERNQADWLLKWTQLSLG